MLTVNLVGGVGNQLFQYAYARTLPSAQLYNACNQYGCHIDRFNTVLPMTLKPEGRWISERGLPFDPNPEVEDPCILAGYWQCEKYFKHKENHIRAELTLKGAPSAAARADAEKIVHDPNSIMLHVRRGDYLTWAKERHGVLPVEYYKEALKQFTNPSVYAFSDDVNYLRSLPFPVTIVNHTPHEDLWLMRLCKNAIIANSSFSWWGAWLGADLTGKVIAPKQWFATGNSDARDIVPERWTQI